jgi:hypothetical protein
MSRPMHPLREESRPASGPILRILQFLIRNPLYNVHPYFPTRARPSYGAHLIQQGRIAVEVTLAVLGGGGTTLLGSQSDVTGRAG